MEPLLELGTGNEQWISILFTAHDHGAIGDLAS